MCATKKTWKRILGKLKSGHFQVNIEQYCLPKVEKTEGKTFKDHDRQRKDYNVEMETQRDFAIVSHSRWKNWCCENSPQLRRCVTHRKLQQQKASVIISTNSISRKVIISPQFLTTDDNDVFLRLRYDKRRMIVLKEYWTNENYSDLQSNRTIHWNHLVSLNTWNQPRQELNLK